MSDHHELGTTNTLITMTAGATAGVVENTLLYPLDTAKTRIQDLSETNIKVAKGTFGTLYQMVREEGFKSPYKGFGITVIGSVPSHAAYFGFYELTKSLLADYSKSSINYGVAGVVATVTHDAIMLPAETIKQRLQLENSPYKTISECFIKVYKSEGIRAFYRAFGTQLIMNIPFQSSHFVMYELMSDLLNPERKYNPIIHVTAGGVAGGVAAAITTPLDVCKTLLNTQTHQSKVIGVRNALKTIYQLAGPFGFFRGLLARVLFFMPSTAICWGVYESMKTAMGLRSSTI